MNHRRVVTPLVLFAVAAALFSSIGCATAPYRAKHVIQSTMKQVLDESHNNRTVNLHVGEKIRIVLPENATTGYRWEIDRYNREVVGVVAEEPNYLSSPGVGSGGHVEFVLEGRKSGVGEFSLKELRSWEGDASVIARFRLYLNVLP